MFKLRFTVVALLAVAAAASSAAADTPDGTTFTATSNPGIVWFCPGGDGQTLADAGCVIHVTLLDPNGLPIVGFPALDMWLAAVVPGQLALCPGSSGADAPTDGQGMTTISGTAAGSGSVQSGMRVLVNGVPAIGSPPLEIQVNSPDISADGHVDLADVGPFSADLNGAPQFRSDFFHDGIINLADVGIFSAHLGHQCP